MVRENPENQRIILDDVKEVDQDSIIVLEDGNKLLIEDQDTVTATVISYDGNVNLLKVTDVTGGEFVKERNDYWWHIWCNCKNCYR